MRISILCTCVAVVGVIVGSAAFADQQITRNTLRLAEGEPQPQAGVDGVAWLAGSWVGKGLGGEVEEIWTAPSGGTMMGGFKLLQEGAPSFYELILILEEEGSLVLRLKHFNPDITGWEEKADSVSFPLVKLTDDAAYFRGLTYRKVGDDRLEVYLAMRRGEDLNEASFIFERAD